MVLVEYVSIVFVVFPNLLDPYERVHSEVPSWFAGVTVTYIPRVPSPLNCRRVSKGIGSPLVVTVLLRDTRDIPLPTLERLVLTPTSQGRGR